ncbi:hypothetical protein MHU86_17636 [Fragilaria crotonensis]|nr:hypothetical protein MHU86_17636 [Fragilaria crotonensis]
MGSTGNKKKVVTAIDLLERNNIFFNSDIEALVEGLPGSEMLPTTASTLSVLGLFPQPLVRLATAWSSPASTSKRNEQAEASRRAQACQAINRRFGKGIQASETRR